MATGPEPTNCELPSERVNYSPVLPPLPTERLRRLGLARNCVTSLCSPFNPSPPFQVRGGSYEFQSLQGAHGAPSSPLPVVSREQGYPVRPCAELPQMRCSVPGS